MYLPSSLLLSFILCERFADVLSNGWRLDSDAEMTPLNPMFEEGDTIVLNCTFTAQYNGTQNSSKLAFKHNRIIYGPEFVHPLTSRTAQLRIPNATLDYYGHFFCILMPDRSLGLLASQDVNIARRPVKPNITECRVRNWESMVCNWIPSREEQKNLTSRNLLYTAAVWHDAGSSSQICKRNLSEGSFILTQNARANFSSCDFLMGRSYGVQIEVANMIKLPVTSDKVYINTSDIVWPNPPENATYSFNGNGTSVLLRWNRPSSRFQYDPLQLTYAVSYKSRWNQTVVTSELLNDTFFTLPATTPFTDYTVWFKVRPLPPNGHWSNEATLQFQTLPTVPCQQPVLDPSVFAFESVTSVTRLVVIYWKPVPENKFCGSDFHYIVSVRSSGNWSVLNRRISDCSTEIPVGPAKTDIRILAKNEAGISTGQHEIVHVPSFNPSFPGLFAVEEVIVEIDRNNSYAAIHWDYTLDSSNVTRVVILWCDSLTSFPDGVKCKNNIEWKELDVMQREFGITVVFDVKHVRVGVSVDLLGISCGIKWSTTVYDIENVAPPPEKFDAVIPHGTDHGSVYVSWKKPKCDHSLCGHINEYILKYCTIAGIEGCTGNQSVSIKANRFDYNLTGLNHGSKYRLWMLSSSRGGLSKSSDVVSVQIAKPWKTGGSIVGMAIGALIAALIVVCGLYGVYRCCRKYKKKITRGVEIVLPGGVPVSKAMKTSSSSETQILYNCYPSGYSRQGSDMSTLSRDSGRFSLTNPCTTTGMVLQQLSPLMSKPNGTLIASPITPLIGIQEDGNTDDVFPEVQGLDGNNYVKTIVIEDPDDNSGYKIIRTVDSYQVNDNRMNAVQYRPKVKKQPEVWVCSPSPGCAAVPDDGLFSQTPVTLCFSGDADKCDYIRITPGTNLDDFNMFYQSPKTVPDPPFSIPPSGSDISYTTVEMLNPGLIIPACVRPGGDCGRNAMDNGYTDLAFLTSSLLGNSNLADSTERSSQTEAKSSNQTDLQTVPCQDIVSGGLSRRSSQPFSSERTSTISELNGNNNSDFKSLISPLKDCHDVASSDQNYAQLNNRLESLPVSSSTQPSFSPSVRENEKENCPDAIPSSVPAQYDNGYILHADLIGNVVNL